MSVSAPNRSPNMKSPARDRFNRLVSSSEQQYPSFTISQKESQDDAPSEHSKPAVFQPPDLDHISQNLSAQFDSITNNDHWASADNEFLDLFMPDDFHIPHHCTSDKSLLLSPNLPKFPLCPGPGLIPHSLTVPRPDPSTAFTTAFPAQAKYYTEVIKHKLPNYLGARLPVSHQININEWRAEEHKLADTQLVDFLEFGFPVGYTSLSKPRLNPMMTRPKRDSSDLRVILDLSFPDSHSVNSAIPKNSLEGSVFKLKLPNPDSLAARIREMGPGTLLYKVDLSRAYRQLRSDPFDWALLGVGWQGDQFIDTAIPFGLRHGASACQRTTQAIASLAKTNFDADIEPYIDDSAGAATPDSAAWH